MTKNFTFFESYYLSIKDLDPTIKAEFYDVLFEYALYDTDPNESVSPIVKALFLMAKPNLDKSKARREAGKKGGSTNKQTEAKEKQTEANGSKTPKRSSDKEKDKEKDKDKEYKKTSKKENYPKPVEEWIEYRKEIRKPIKDRTIKSLVNDFLKDEELFTIKVNHSIASGYQGLFAPKDNNSTAKPSGGYKSKRERVGDLIDDYFDERQNTQTVIEGEVL